jgi:hypothetical protein
MEFLVYLNVEFILRNRKFRALLFLEWCFLFGAFGKQLNIPIDSNEQYVYILKSRICFIKKKFKLVRFLL